jgi:hypothetical protein
VSKANLEIEDKILDEISENKTIKNQSQIVLEYFTKQFDSVEVVDTNKQRATEIVQSIHKQHHIPIGAITYKSIALSTALMGREMGDLNLFKKPIEEWDEPYWQDVLGQFLIPTQEARND